MNKDNCMKTLLERQRNEATFNRKKGTLTKQKEKEIYTKYIIDKEEKEKKEKEKDPRKLEIYARKFIENLKDSRIHQNELGDKEDFITLGKVIKNKEDVEIPNKMAQLLSRKFIYKTDPKSLVFKNEDMQRDAILSQSDHKSHYIDKKLGFKEFGDKNFYIELSTGNLFKGISKINSPDGILIKLESDGYHIYFVELKNTNLFQNNKKGDKTNTLTSEGRYLKFYLGKNNISKLQRIGVCSDTNEAIERFKKLHHISTNSKIMNTQQFSDFMQGAVPILNTVKGDHITLSNHPIFEKIFNAFTQKGLSNEAGRITKKKLEENINKFIKFSKGLKKINWNIPEKQNAFGY